MSKALQLPLDLKVKTLQDLPYTISFVIKKRQQIDSFRELPSSKQPPEDLIWDGTPEELDDWFDKVMDRKEKQEVVLDISDIES